MTTATPDHANPGIASRLQLTCPVAAGEQDNVMRRQADERLCNFQRTSKSWL
jgi:hypothetical protein